MSLLTVPRSASSGSSKRNSARLDLLSAFLNSPKTQNKKSSEDNSSPRDSLSPLDDHNKHDLQVKGRSRSSNRLLQDKASSPEGRTRSRISSVTGSSSPRYAQLQASSRDAQTEQELHFTFQRSDVKHEAATLAPSTTEACLPRSSLITRDHRPPGLKLTRTNGSSAITVQELKQQIVGDGHTDSCTAITQVPRRPPKRHSRTPTAQAMGNKPSSVSGDDASEHSIVRRPARVLRKSSTNPFKRIDSKSPLPLELTRTVIEVQQQVSPTTNGNDENDESPIDPFMDGTISPNSSDVPPLAVHSASTVTITNNSGGFRPLSASTTIRDSRVDSRKESRLGNHTSFVEDFESDSEHRSTQPLSIPSHHRSLALSPSIPAPSPLPEDSPHKYGLKDRMDTPEVPEPEDISLIKARRRSSGLDIFNEAKSLQSASSFLNGLSTSRRRAESTQRLTEASGWTSASYDTTRPSSSYLPSRPSSTRPHSTVPSNTYSGERRRGHSFKPSGFAYTRPLTLTQMKCYRSHVRLLPSKNKSAPVECSVCHIDEQQDHFSCSWCALRMCRFCRKDFAERGMGALKERIKQAELGGSSPSSSSESLGRGRRAYV